MGCSASVPDQNTNAQPQRQQPPPPSKVPTAPPPKEPTPPPPKEPTPPPPKEPTPPPPKEPTPPPPKEPTPPPPKEPTPPPPKEPTPPPPKEPTPPPPKEPTPPPPKEPTLPPTDDTKLTSEVLQEFINLEKKLQNLQQMKCEEKSMLYELELNRTEENIKLKEQEVKEAKEKVSKEYQDIANFNVQTYMISNQISYLSKEQVDEARSKEEQEYLEAKNTEDIHDKELDKLKLQILKIQEKLDDMKLNVEELGKVQDQQDGLLENIFNGDYGSKEEEQLEDEADVLLKKKQKINAVHMTWVSSKQLLTTSCTQMSYAVNRWKQIEQYPQITNQGKFIMSTETRNHLISAHMNMRHAADLLKVNLPYWNAKDDKDMVISINLVYNDVRHRKTYDRAMAWYKYYYWRYALLLNWIEQVINTRILEDMKNFDKAFKEKYQLLKMERLRLIKDIVKEKLDVDLDIEQFRQEDTETENGEIDTKPENMLEPVDGQYENGDLEKAEDLPEAVEQEEDPTSLDALQTVEPEEPNESLEESSKNKQQQEQDEEKPDEENSTEETKESEDQKVGSEEQDVKPEEGEVKPEEGEVKPEEGEVKPENTSTDEPVKSENVDGANSQENTGESAPQIKAIPLEELAPLPTSDELFGEVEKLMDDVEKGEEVLEKNKFRQEQDLQDRLRRRRSKRKRMQDLEDDNQEN